MSKASKTAPVVDKAPEIEVKNEPEKAKTNVMYLGPTITGAVRHSTVFKDGVFTDKVKKCVAELPVMARLFVPIEELPAAIKELNKSQSVLGAIYAQVVNKFM